MTKQALTTTGTPLRELLADGAQILGPSDVRANGCTSQSRHVRPGDVFVALTEDEHDGHDFAHDAAKRGASAIICERPLPIFDVPQFVVADSRVAYGQLCQALVGNPSKQLKVIGVGGTAGKTTIARLLHSIFRAAGTQAGTLDSFGYWNGINDTPSSGRFPDRASHRLSPPHLARQLAEMVVAGATHAIVEVSSRDLVQGTLAGVTLDSVCISHIGRGDIAWHGSVENYRQAQRRILTHTSPEAAIILNADDDYSMRILGDLEQPALTFGLKQPSEITAEIVEQFANEQTFVLTAGDESVGVRTPIIGDHHVENCLAAAATCLSYGIDLTTIARGLEAVDQLPGRMERIMCGQDFATFIDAAATPNSLRAVLRAARKVTKGRVICVFGTNDDGTESFENAGPSHTIKLPYLTDSESPALGRVAGTMADMAILTSACDYGTAPITTLAGVRHGFVDGKTSRTIPNRLEAIVFALREARAGDTVVVAGMGNREYVPDQSGTRWTDREAITTLLRGPRDTEPKLKLVA